MLCLIPQASNDDGFAMRQSSGKVAVVGLGAVGAMALLSLARRGADPIGFEQFTLGHDDGAFGGGTRRLRLATPGDHGGQHVRLARESLRLWERLQRAAGENLFIPTGELGIGPSDDPDICSLTSCLRTEGLDCEILSPAEVARRFPQHALADDEIGVYSRDGGVLRSNRGVAAAARVAERLGAVVHQNSRVQAIEEIGGRAVLIANGQQFVVDRVVVTTGPWVGELVPTIRSAVTTRCIVSTWFEPAPGGSFACNTFPPGFRRSRSGHSYTFLPELDGSEAKFIFWIPERPEIADPSSWERTSDRATIDSTCLAVAATIYGAAPRPSRVETYMEGFTADRWPVVGQLGECMTLLAGFSGGGFGVAPVMGEVAADLTLEGSTLRNITDMSLHRFGFDSRPVQKWPTC